MPRENEKPQLGVRVSERTIRDLDRLAAETDISKTAHVQSALNEYLARELAKLQPKKD